MRGQSRGRPPLAPPHLPHNQPGLKSHRARAAGRRVRTEGAGPRLCGGRGVGGRGRSGAPAESPTTKGGGARPAVVASCID